MGIVAQLGTVISAAADKFTQLTAQIWKGFNRTAFLYTPPGDNSIPCKNDQIVLVKVDGTGRYSVIGVLEKSQGANPGEKILFARDADGEVVSKISMLNSGDVSIETSGRFSIQSESDSVFAAENISFEAEKKATLKGADVELNGNVKATGGEFRCDGVASPTGTGCLCGVPFCLVTGSPHSGNKASGT